MNRIVILILFSSLLILYLYKYSYPKVIEGMKNSRKGGRDGSRRRRRRRSKLKMKNRKRLQNKKKNKENEGNNGDNETDDDVNVVDDYIDIKKEHIIDHIKNIQSYLIKIGNQLKLTLLIDSENKKIQARNSMRITRFNRLLSKRKELLSNGLIQLYPNENDRNDILSHILGAVDNTQFINDISPTISLLKNYLIKITMSRMVNNENNSVYIGERNISVLTELEKRFEVYDQLLDVSGEGEISINPPTGDLDNNNNNNNNDNNNDNDSNFSTLPSANLTR